MHISLDYGIIRRIQTCTIQFSFLRWDDKLKSTKMLTKSWGEAAITKCIKARDRRGGGKEGHNSWGGLALGRDGEAALMHNADDNFVSGRNYSNR